MFQNKTVKRISATTNAVCALLVVMGFSGSAQAVQPDPTPPANSQAGGLVQCNINLNNALTELTACEAQPKLPGDGVTGAVLSYTDNGDGTITDNVSGLIWLKDVSCFGTVNWINALTAVAALTDGECNLTDGSSAGDWRLPNIKELVSIVDYAVSNPSSDAIFMSASFFHWSSTENVFDLSEAYTVNFLNGRVQPSLKTFLDPVRPVRGGL